jgi:hypothetical protein
LLLLLRFRLPSSRFRGRLWWRSRPRRRSASRSVGYVAFLLLLLLRGLWCHLSPPRWIIVVCLGKPHLRGFFFWWFLVCCIYL